MKLTVRFFHRLLKKYSILTSILIVFSSTFQTELALAYDTIGSTWESDPAIRAANISFPVGSVWRDDLQNGMDRWNGVWGMWLEFDYRFANINSYQVGDNNNDVGFVNGADIGNAWGMTSVSFSGDEIVEIDMAFNNGLNWRTGAQDERQRITTSPAFRKVVVHEFGHALGLDHFCNELAQMAQGYAGHVWYGGNPVFRHHPMADDLQGARALYPYPNQEIDVALLNFEMAGTCSSQVWRNNTASPTIRAGSTFDIEYTVANIGNVGSNFVVGVYLSSNDYISTYDTYLNGVSYYMTHHHTDERDLSVTIPCNVSPGTYYMGAVVDANNSLAEVRESNNRLVFPGTWQISAAAATPDLTISHLSHSPANPTTDDTITFTTVVRNAGCTPANASKVGIKVGGETYPKIYDIPSLGPHEAHAVHRQISLRAGRYGYIVTADINNIITETLENNNEQSDTFTVTAAPSCTDGAQRNVSCQTGGQTGTRHDVCVNGDWVIGQCQVAQCITGDERYTSCWVNGRTGYRRSVCVNGQWQTSGCTAGQIP